MRKVLTTLPKLLEKNSHFSVSIVRVAYSTESSFDLYINSTVPYCNPRETNSNLSQHYWNKGCITSGVWYLTWLVSLSPQWSTTVRIMASLYSLAGNPIRVSITTSFETNCFAYSISFFEICNFIFCPCRAAVTAAKFLVWLLAAISRH